ncbi:ABC transporter ATP-binding protein [Thermoleptolyngbya sichuanensis XZ-Cy5]|uniref:ABC transporter ATP-binding protein n=1 Tax=Thermoleptolyngbya sichuanensis TaxID=2885951 RepID=UPI00240D8569|nr:ABC transporter ATP-binding protein [Thermoleptolyngbya sichuanensis]MDG2614948.1 ABC transporter ATP-binding protein [Thermoleptolyngbya sichuanensis XZ-Cy5]
MAQTITPNQSTVETETQYDVELRRVFKVFDGYTAVRGIDLNVRQGEFFSILGPSGCGKTTTLRLVAGFDEPTAGEVLLQGRSMVGVPPYRRPVNTVFQSYALFGHMTVWDNVAFGLRLKNKSKAEVQKAVGEALQLVKMESFSRRYPAQLSGGQQQRVALARALANQPTVVLLDEPLGALDLKLRKEMQVELSTLHRELGVTFIMVTHDQEEALSLSDRIAVMNEGRVEQIGTPSEIYEFPATPFVADFIGETNLFQGYMAAADPMLIKVETERGLQMVVKPTEACPGAAAEPVVVSIRPEKVRLSLEPPGSEMNCFEGRLRHTMYLGTHVHYVVDLPTGDMVTVMRPNRPESMPQVDTPVYVSWSAADALPLAIQPGA